MRQTSSRSTVRMTCQLLLPQGALVDGSVGREGGVLFLTEWVLFLKNSTDPAILPETS